jgi:hypothetical protein
MTWTRWSLLALALALGGCVRVRPHERQTLAHPGLAQPPWRDAQAAHDHVYQVREGTEGAVGAGGGGCGCN